MTEFPAQPWGLCRDADAGTRYHRGTNQDGPGSVGALFVRGLADYEGVDW